MSEDTQLQQIRKELQEMDDNAGVEEVLIEVELVPLKMKMLLDVRGVGLASARGKKKGKHHSQVVAIIQAGSMRGMMPIDAS